MSEDRAEYRFDCEVVSRPIDSYFVTRWDRATPVSVVATNESEAYQKIWALVGDARYGHRWVARVKRITDIRLAQDVET